MGVGGSIMPSSEYFRRQANVCLRLSLISSSEEVSNRLIVMAQGYNARAAEGEGESQSPLVAVPAESISPDS
jgi:hypothetical protein